MSTALISGLRTITPELLARLDEGQRDELHAKLGEMHHETIDQRCAKDVSSFAAGPLFWLTHWTLTENPKYLEQGLKFKAPFPDKSYFVPLFKAFHADSRLFIPKTREMITSWSVMAHCTHASQYRKAFCVVQTESETKVWDLLRYCRILHENQPEWMQDRHPFKSDPSKTEIEWADGGRILGIPKGESKIRLYHPTIYVMDEAAFLPEAEACYNAAHPVAQQIIAISSAGPGWFGDQCSNRGAFNPQPMKQAPREAPAPEIETTEETVSPRTEIHVPGWQVSRQLTETLNQRQRQEMMETRSRQQ